MSALMKLAEVPLAHQLPYWWVGDSAYVMHDGTLGLGWRLHGLDVSTMADEGLTQLAQQLRSALNALPIGTAVQVLRHVTVVPSSVWDTYAAQLRTADPTLRTLRQRTAAHLRAQRFRANETHLIITRPKALGELGARNARGFDRLVNAVLGLKDPASITREGHAQALEALVQGTSPFIRSLTGAGVRLERLDDAALVALAYGFLNPSRAARGDSPALVDEELPETLSPELHRVYRPLSLREQLITSGLSWSADTLFLDDPIRPHRLLGLKALPPQTTTSLIRHATKIPFEHWLSLTFAVPDSEAKYATIETRRNRAKVAASGHARNMRAAAQAKELETAMGRMVERDQRVYSVSAHVLVGADDLLELDRRTNAVVDVFREVHMPFATEQQAQLFAWRGMLPGNGHQATHPRTCLTDNAADLLPVYEPSTGARRPLFVAAHRTGEPYFLDIADPSRTNWNNLVFGGSGGGKSFFTLSLITSSMLAQGSDLIVIDVGGPEVGSYYRLSQLLGGEFVDLNLDGRNPINPFPDRETLFLDAKGNPSDEPNPLRILSLLTITKLLVTDDPNGNVGRAGEAVLRRAILATYAHLTQRTPLFDDLIATLAAIAEGRLPGDAEDQAAAKRMGKILVATLSGPIGKLINRPSVASRTHRFTVFDLFGLEALGDLAPVVLLVVTAHIWNMVGRQRDGIAWLVLDEIWAMLRHALAANIIAELYSTARKLDIGIFGITQRVGSLLACPSAGAMTANSENVFLLKHKDNEVAPVAEFLKLNPRQTALLAGLKTLKGQYSELFLRQETESSVLRYAASPWEYWVNTTDPRDRELEHAALATCGGDRLAALHQLVQSHPHGASGGARKAPHAP